MSDPLSHTRLLLERWHAGEREALDALIARDLPWIREQVRRRLGPVLRGRAETQDFVHDALLDVLRYVPKFTCADRERFRALLVRIIENTLRDRHDWYRARRRAAEREASLPGDSALPLDGSAASPSRVVERRESEQWLRLALELMDPDDRMVIVLREWDKLPFEEVGARIGCTPEAARKRFARALPKLVERIRQLQQGRIDPLEDPSPEQDT